MTKQYEPCEHRHPYNLIGSEEPVYYDTPCEKCEAANAETTTTPGERTALVVACVLVAVAVVAYLVRSS
jgi:hypothetical protein